MHQHDTHRNSQPNTSITFSTEQIQVWRRQEWLREVIGREYANVDIKVPGKDRLFNEMTIYPWDKLRLSIIRSNAINIQRLPQEPYLTSQDAYFAVVLLSGEYLIEQNGREAFLKPGDMTIYDATQPHHIYCPKSFSKLIISIPRHIMRDRLAGVEHCTALRINGNQKLGAIASNFMRTTAQQANTLSTHQFIPLAEHSLELLTLALNTVRPQPFNLSRSRSLSLYRVKDFVERNLKNPSLNAEVIASGTGLSARYINDLFQDEESSLMRHVWQRRLDQCYKEITNPMQSNKQISEIAMYWGFNDLSHFSRAFKYKFGASPRSLKTKR